MFLDFIKYDIFVVITGIRSKDPHELICCRVGYKNMDGSGVSKAVLTNYLDNLSRSTVPNTVKAIKKQLKM
jgi:hypothetical protein